MRLYKYRSISQLDFVFDIIYNHRLYCASRSELNDPMEAQLVKRDLCAWEDVDPSEDEEKSTMADRGFYRICSLSSSRDKYLLWSHYASGFRGVVVEVDIPEKDFEKVSYLDMKYGETGEHVPFGTVEDLKKAEYQSLTKKLTVWEYEDECRILQEEKWYKLETGVTGIIVGDRQDGISDATWKALKCVCDAEKIIIHFARVCSSEVKIYDSSHRYA